MKRRDFLATAAALSLLSGEALAAKKKTASKPASSSSSRKPTTARHSAKPAPAPAPSGPVTHTADDPITEKPPAGTSATRLPPVKAAEPPADWRIYEVSTTVTVKGGAGPTRLWLPLPLN